MNNFKAAVTILQRHAAKIENDLDEKIMSGIYTVDFRRYMEDRQNELEEAIALLTAGPSNTRELDSELIEYGFNKGWDAGLDEVQGSIRSVRAIVEAKDSSVRNLAKIGYLGIAPYKRFIL